MNLTEPILLTIADDLDAISRIEAIPNILEVVCRMTGMGFAAVARVTEDRWIACAVRDEIAFGLRPGGELKVETTICDEIRASGLLVVIDNASEDEIFCNHPTPKMYGFQSYISVPIYRSGGRFFGTLCAIDPKSARLNTPQTIGMFKLFADLIAFHLDAQERVQVTEAALKDERNTARLREQFIAILGHDLRNPLNAISSGALVLQRMSLGDDATSVVATVQRGAVRMTELIDNVMDFARGQLGDGIPLVRVEVNLEAVLEQVLDEARIIWPDREIQQEIVLGSVACDGARIAQMFSNLLANALTHGDPDGPVRVRAHDKDGYLELSVANLGQPLKPELIDRLFQPFSRASAEPGQEGLGLGLYIASEIAKAHGGSLQVSSTSKETCFTFRMKCTQSDGAPVRLEARPAGISR
jgi:signal transduction histidine kinase